MERTLVLLKPDAIERALIGRIIARFEDKGLRIVGMKMMRLEEDLLHEHYSHLKELPVFPAIVAFMMSAPVVALCIEGLEAVQVVRSMCGMTRSRAALPGTIRGDLGMSIRSNLVHASDSPETAEVEVRRFFDAAELFAYERRLDTLIHIPDKT
ncbi:MAG: nucleoside-diphosphate kinase [Syntrophaceae bacterium]